MTARPATRARRLAATLAAVALALPALAACDFDGAYDLPLPSGGPDLGGDAGMTVTAVFDDVLNVVPRSPVMVSDVVVGEVTEVERRGWDAEVTLRLRSDVVLPDNAVAEIRQTSLLGEKYVALLEPAAEPVGQLEDGDAIPRADTGRNPEVEEVLGALSTVLSGGGVAQLEQISTEVNALLDGRQDEARSLLRRLRDLVGGLDDQKGDILRALESVDELASTLQAEAGTIESALDATGPALRVLNRQHDQLVGMLRSLDRLGVVGERVIGGTKEDLLAGLASLEPTLRQLSDAGDSLPRGLSLAISFPFPEEAMENVKGDYANALFAVDISLEGLTQILQPAPGSTGPGGILLPDLPALPQLQVPPLE